MTHLSSRCSSLSCGPGTGVFGGAGTFLSSSAASSLQRRGQFFLRLFVSFVPRSAHQSASIYEVVKLFTIPPLLNFLQLSTEDVACAVLQLVNVLLCLCTKLEIKFDSDAPVVVGCLHLFLLFSVEQKYFFR